MASLVASFPDWLVSLVQWVLLGGEVLATVVVGWGILWEAPEESPSRHRIAKWLVIWGILAEMLCSISLFAFDEAIARNQRDKIIALETRLAPRDLSPSDQRDVTNAASPFSSQEFKITPYSEDPESVHISRQIASALVGANWVPIQVKGPVALLGVIRGVVIYSDDEAPDSTKKAADALADVLNSKNIAATVTPSLNHLTPAQLNVTVGIKP
jgi:hypothetical protein